jgi:hypothetical protein
VRLRLIRWVARWLAKRGKAWALVRPDGSLYLARHIIKGNSPAPRSPDSRSVYLHHIAGPDADPWPHSHDWTWSFAILLSGSYIEERDGELRTFETGDINWFDGRMYHRIVSVAPDTWTLFVSGRTEGNVWGFLINGKHVSWRDAPLTMGGWVQLDENGARL